EPEKRPAKRVLVIEDEPLVALDMKEILGGAGHDVVGPACNLTAARQLLAENKFDLAIVDVNLGDENGSEIAAALAKRGAPFAFVTGYGRTALPEDLRKAPLLRKPFGESELLGVVETLSAKTEPQPRRVIPLRPRAEL